MSEALRQSLLAIRQACAQLKSDAPAPLRARLDMITTVLARLIVDERDRPALLEALLREYRALGLQRPGTRGQSGAGAGAAETRAIARLEGDFAAACEQAIAAELRLGEPAAAPEAPQEQFDRDAFRRYLVAALGEDPGVEVADVQLASRGFSKKTLLVSLRRSRMLPAEIALRVDRPFNFLGTTVNDEFAPLVALHAAGLRLPRPFALEGTGKVLDGPFIIFEKKVGTLIGNNFQSPQRNPAVAADVARCLAQVHRTDPSRVPALRGLGLSAEAQAREDLDKSLADYRGLNRSVPLMDAAFDWLYAHLDRTAGECGVVHGDFNFNNILIDQDRVAAIVDWEFLHAGNPAADLGWFHYGAEGICGWQEFLRLYEQAGGFKLDPVGLDYYCLFGQTRLAVMTLQTDTGFNEGRFDDLKFGLAGALYVNKALVRVGALLGAIA